MKHGKALSRLARLRSLAMKNPKDLGAAEFLEENLHDDLSKAWREACAGARAIVQGQTPPHAELDLERVEAIARHELHRYATDHDRLDAALDRVASAA